MKLLAWLLLSAVAMATAAQDSNPDSAGRLKKRGVLGLGVGYPALGYPATLGYPALPATYPYPTYVPAATTFPGYYGLRYPGFGYPTTYTYTFSG